MRLARVSELAHGNVPSCGRESEFAAYMGTG